MARGKKNCPNCNTESGVRTQLCDKCGWYYPEEKVRQDLLDAQVKEVLGPVYYDKEGQGRKKCPGCSKIVGCRLKQCYCGFDFAAAKESKIKEESVKEAEVLIKKEDTVPVKGTISKTDKIFAEMRNFTYVPPKILNKREYAQEVLDRGVKTATFLYRYAKSNRTWSHVDWNYVGQQLGLTDENSVNEDSEVENDAVETSK